MLLPPRDFCDIISSFLPSTLCLNRLSKTYSRAPFSDSQKLWKAASHNRKFLFPIVCTSAQHEQWVLELADRLSGDGIVVTLDKRDLKEGQESKHAFMEQMVNDPNIGKVLVICDRGYQAKADDPKGGVGTETQLISKEVYENTGQEKFIPVVREYDQDGKPCIPHFMGSRI